MRLKRSALAESLRQSAVRPRWKKRRCFRRSSIHSGSWTKQPRLRPKSKIKPKRSHRFKAKAADSARIFFWMRKSLEERCTRLNCRGSNARRIRTCGKRRSSRLSTSGSSQNSGRSRPQKRKPSAQHGKPNGRNRLRRKAHNNSFAQSELGTDLR